MTGELYVSSNVTRFWFVFPMRCGVAVGMCVSVELSFGVSRMLFRNCVMMVCGDGSR